jgi:hypothetical protein
MLTAWCRCSYSTGERQHLGIVGLDQRREFHVAQRLSDPYWRDHLLFYEYFHGDNGAGIGASHQTGWTGLVAPLTEIFGHLDAQTFLEGGRATAFQHEQALP